MTQALDPSRIVPNMRQGWAQLALLYTYWSWRIEQYIIFGSELFQRSGPNLWIHPELTKVEARVGTATYPVHLLIWEYWAGPNLWIHPELSPSWGKGGQQAGHSYLSCILTGLGVLSRTQFLDPSQTVPKLRQRWAAGWQNHLSRCPGLEGAGGGNCRTYVISIFLIGLVRVAIYLSAGNQQELQSS